MANSIGNLMFIVLVWALLLAGCATPVKGGSQGKVTVSVAYVATVGCGAPPLDGQAANCSSSKYPYSGSVIVNVTNLTGLPTEGLSYKALQNRTISLGTLVANQSGEIEFELPPGEYYATIFVSNPYGGNAQSLVGTETKPFSIEPGKNVRVEATFSILAPGVQP